MIATDPRADAAALEIVTTRVFAAPQALVWEAFTDPVHIAKWWGPRGFTTHTRARELRPGGAWRFVMRGPDGRGYENVVTYIEVLAPERLVYKHGGAGDSEAVNFETTVTFEALSGETPRTLLTMRAVFPTAAARKFVVQQFNAIERGRQTLERFAEHLDSVRTRELHGDDTRFVISQVFSAPAALVWAAWTERQHLMAWFGPKGTSIDRCTLNLVLGGLFHYSLLAPDGRATWGRWLIRDIAAPHRLLVNIAFADVAGDVIRHPLNADWPLETEARVVVAEHAGIGRGTTVEVSSRPVDPTATECAAFAEGRNAMLHSWSETFERLTSHLAARQVAPSSKPQD